jgi:hypothetical protein
MYIHAVPGCDGPGWQPLIGETPVGKCPGRRQWQQRQTVTTRMLVMPIPWTGLGKLEEWVKWVSFWEHEGRERVNEQREWSIRRGNVVKKVPLQYTYETIQPKPMHFFGWKRIISDSDLKVISNPDLNMQIISDTDPQHRGEENCEVREGREGVVKWRKGRREKDTLSDFLMCRSEHVQYIVRYPPPM